MVSVAEGGGYACSECGRVFAVENYCKKHMRLVHGIRFVQEAVQAVVMNEIKEPVQSEEGEVKMYQVVVDEEGKTSQEFEGEEVEIQYANEDGIIETTEITFLEEDSELITT